MKTSFVRLMTGVLMLVAMAAPTAARAQAAEDGKGARFSFLSADEKAHLLKVREQVFARHPELKAEQESLTQERESVKGKGTDVSAEDRKTLRENFMAHGEKMAAAMVEADPTIKPVLDKMNAKMKERFQARAGEAADAAAAN